MTTYQQQFNFMVTSITSVFQRYYFTDNLGISSCLISIPNIQTPPKGSCPCLVETVFLVIHFLLLGISSSHIFSSFPWMPLASPFPTPNLRLTSLHTRATEGVKQRQREKWGQCLQSLLPCLECTDPQKHQWPSRRFWGLG